MSPESFVDSFEDDRSSRSLSVDLHFHDATTPDLRDEGRSGRTDYFVSAFKKSFQCPSTPSAGSQADQRVPSRHPLLLTHRAAGKVATTATRLAR